MHTQSGLLLYLLYFAAQMLASYVVGPIFALVGKTVEETVSRMLLVPVSLRSKEASSSIDMYAAVFTLLFGRGRLQI